MTTNNYRSRWPISSVLRYVPMLVCIIGFALLSVSCASKKRHLSQQIADTSYEHTSRKTTIRESLVSLPADSVTAVIPLTSLHNALPDGAGFFKKSGRANLSVVPRQTPEGVVLDIKSSCDSIQQLLREMVEENEALKAKLSEAKTKLSEVKKSLPTYFMRYVWVFIVSALVGVGGTIVVQIKYNNKNK